jgi:hypothetical protein
MVMVITNAIALLVLDNARWSQNGHQDYVMYQWHNMVCQYLCQNHISMALNHHYLPILMVISSLIMPSTVLPLSIPSRHPKPTFAE